MSNTNQDALENFTEDTSRHEMAILRDDGLYRHLRFQRPGSCVYQFDIITWPGYLAYVGDMGDYVFRRIDDMFEFFGSDGINPDYWSEKVQAACTDGVREFSIEVYKERVEKWRDEILEDIAEDIDNETDNPDFAEVVNDDLLDWVDGITEEEAHRRLDNFECNGIKFFDSWEWDFQKFSYRYIWSLYAITWAIRKYQEQKMTSPLISTSNYDSGDVTTTPHLARTIFALEEASL